jgi:hypothetical protein
MVDDRLALEPPPWIGETRSTSGRFDMASLSVAVVAKHEGFGEVIWTMGIMRYND